MSLHAIVAVLNTPGHAERETVLKNRFAFSLRRPISGIPLLRKRTKFTGRFFVATDDSICIAVGNMKTRGYPVGLFEQNGNLKSVKLLDNVKAPTGSEIVKSMVKRFHPKAWLEMKRDLLDGTCRHEFATAKPRFVSVRKIFENHYRQHRFSVENELKHLQAAFDECREYKWIHHARTKSGRDITIHVVPEDDGNSVKAWLSSEFCGCANGSYYLLVSPTTAIHYEDD